MNYHRFVNVCIIESYCHHSQNKSDHHAPLHLCIKQMIFRFSIAKLAISAVMDITTDIVVKKELLEIDERNLYVWNRNPWKKECDNDVEAYVRFVTASSAQAFIEKLWALPSHRINENVVVNLPESKTTFPREKPVPKPKPPTKWEKFAKAKGIVKKKRDKIVFDEVHNDWRRKYGYKKANDTADDWLIEIPDNDSDPYKDYFEERKKKQKEIKAKYEYQRLKNISRAVKLDVKNLAKKNTAIIPESNKEMYDYCKALRVAQSSDASLGKFSMKNRGEEERVRGFREKRTFDQNVGNFKSEKKKYLKILDELEKTKEKIDIEKGVNMQINEENEMRRKTKMIDGKDKKRSLSKRINQKKQRMHKGKKRNKSHRKK